MESTQIYILEVGGLERNASELEEKIDELAKNKAL